MNIFQNILSNTRKAVFLFLFIICPATFLKAEYAITNLTNMDGLSNSSVNCIFQDSSGLMWFGTWDGLNLYNSREFKVYKPEMGNANSICNNIIRTVIEENNEVLWIATDRGIDRLDRRRNEFSHYFTRPGGQPPLVEQAYLIAKNSLGSIIISVYEEGLFLFDSKDRQFASITSADIRQAKKIFFDRDDHLWVYTSDRQLVQMVSDNSGGFLSNPEKIVLPANYGHIENVFYDRGRHRLYLPNGQGHMFVYNIYSRTFEPQAISVEEESAINAMIFTGGYVFWGSNSGLYRYNPTSRQTDRLLAETPVLSLLAGSQQMIWVGTDMQGVYMLTPKQNNFFPFTAENVSGLGKNAVRCFLETGNEELWVGTKGGGICVFKQTGDKTIPTVKRRITMHDGLLSNSIYTLKEGGRNEYWIGTDGEGLNYADRQRNRICTLHIPEQWKDSIKLSSVYSILPDGRDTLWIGTSGEGMYRLEIDKRQHPYSIRSFRQYTFDKNNPHSLANNIIYSIIADDEQHLWIGTRGGGVNRFDKRNGQFTAYRFTTDETNHISNDDVLCLYKDRKGCLWIGTSMGLNKMETTPDGETSFKLFTRQDGIPNNTIHGILEDNDQNLWISTNRGLAKVTPSGKGYRIISYFRKDGLQNDEFSDGAYYKSPAVNRLYFGGVGGFNTFNPSLITDDRYMPRLLLDAFYIQNTESNLYEHLKMRKGRETLILKHNMRSISLRFVPVDYVSGEKCETSYLLEGYNDDWVYLGTSSTIVLSNLPSGKYTLKVRNSNAAKTWNETGFSLPIVMLPPWWATWWAWLIYLTLSAFLIFMIQRQIAYRLKTRRAIKFRELEKQRIEEIHQAKLRFFTNIAHEFSNSLTLIYAPCEQLMKFSGNDEIRRYVNTIRSNSQRMQSLIQQLIEFRKAETGHLNVRIEPVDITELVRYVLDNFMESLEEKRIQLSINQPSQPLIWNTDRDGVEKVVFNLLSNAVKYTPLEECIEVYTAIKDDMLYLSVRNTGVGVKQANTHIIFDRFKVLERFEMQISEGFETRSGIGLALCKNIVEVLGGSIKVESDGETYTTFIVELPIKQAEKTTTETRTAPIPVQPEPETLPYPGEEESATPGLSNDKLILVVDDDKEIRQLLKDILSERFDVMEATNGQEALNAVNLRMPQLIICDVIMPVMNGIEFTKRMKEQDLTRHIPIVLLSSQSSIDDQIEGIETGADAYLSKPFHPRHLHALIDGLIRKKQIITEYSHSYYAGVEAFNNKIIHKENKDLLIQIHRIINENLENESLSAEFIAHEMALSKMQLYRKIKELTDETPTELIRSIRLEAAGKLLVTTNKTVQEIMFCTGFNNKAYFYREFAKKYQLTPKEYRNKKNTGE